MLYIAFLLGYGIVAIMVRVERLSRGSPEARETRRMLSIYRANERSYYHQRDDLTSQYPNKWIAVYNRGKDFLVAETRQDLLKRARDSGLTQGTEFVTHVAPREVRGDTPAGVES